MQIPTSPKCECTNERLMPLDQLAERGCIACARLLNKIGIQNGNVIHLSVHGFR